MNQSEAMQYLLDLGLTLTQAEETRKAVCKSRPLSFDLPDEVIEGLYQFNQAHVVAYQYLHDRLTTAVQEVQGRLANGEDIPAIIVDSLGSE